MPIIWTKPDGTIRVMQLGEKFLAAHRLPDEATEDAVRRLVHAEQAKNADLADAVPVLVTSADLPSDRHARHKWRLREGVVVEDATIPDRPDPVAAIEADIDRAGTLGEIKAALKRMVRLR